MMFAPSHVPNTEKVLSKIYLLHPDVSLPIQDWWSLL